MKKRRMKMKNRALTLTMLVNMTSNYSESLGNIASVQKVVRNGKVYSIRSKESLKNALMVQSGMYDDLHTVTKNEDKSSGKSVVLQKLVDDHHTVANCRSLEGGYMNTMEGTKVRKSSIYVTDAISCDSFINMSRFHTNLYLSNNYVKENKLKDNKSMMIYQYEYDKSLKVYSVTIDLEMIGKDDNFDLEAPQEEKAKRVHALLEAIQTLSIVVKGNLDNAEPIFVVGGLSDRKTHYFENNIHVKNNQLVLTEDLLLKLQEGYRCGLAQANILDNEEDIKQTLHALRIKDFFEQLKKDVDDYYTI